MTTKLTWLLWSLVVWISIDLTTSSATAGNFSLPLEVDNSTKLDLGFFLGGTSLHITFSGNGDLVSAGFPASWPVQPDGSLFAPATGRYDFANPGATNYSTAFGGDGTNHFSGGGANFDPFGDSTNQFGFAGLETTDTTNLQAIRFGSVVGTFALIPTRSDWFFIGFDRTLVVPTGGDHLYVAVNDSYSPGNQGTYSGNFDVANAPEPGSLTLLGIGIAGVACYRWSRKKQQAKALKRLPD